MSRPRVAIVGPLKQWGGLERVFAILADEFAAAGIIPEFVRLRDGQMPYVSSMPSEARSVDLGTKSKFDGVPKVARYLRNESPDAILTVRDHSAQVCVVARAITGTRVPLFICATSMPSIVIRRKIQRHMARWLYPRADGVIAVSEGAAADVSEHFGVPRERVHVIYNPVITRDFYNRCRKNVPMGWFMDDQEIPLIVSAGRLEWPKDFGSLVDAFAQLREWRSARLVILGDGKDRDRIQRRASFYGVQHEVAIHGYVDDPVPYMWRSSLFVFASRYEGMGNVLAEALGSGTRIVATDCRSGPREILDGGRYGRLVPVGDPGKMALAMNAALDDARPSESTVSSASERFRSGTVAGRYRAVLGL